MLRLLPGDSTAARSRLVDKPQTRKADLATRRPRGIPAAAKTWPAVTEQLLIHPPATGVSRAGLGLHFVEARTYNGRKFRFLTISDEASR